jgi:predicted small secreted protein
MTRLPLIAIVGLAALAACSQQTANSIGNDFDRTSNAVSENANALQADTANAINAAQDALDNQTAAFSNRIDDMGNRLDAAGNALTSDSGNRQ